MMATEDNTEIMDKITNFEKIFFQFKSELKCFENLKSGYKIFKDNNTNILYCEEPGNWIWLKRWFYGENREKTFKYLDEIFTQFVKFLDSILRYLRENKYCSRIIILNFQICEYINSIIPGLCSIKYTYPKYADIHAKIASIVVTLIDFKQETYKYTKKK